jgi:citrate lyase subunit beta/citryl-CoA lyase
MIFHDTATLQRAIDEGDFETLDSFIYPKLRQINYASTFRAALMLSANNLKHLNKIDELGAECIMFNLEDGVAPEQKPLALRLCALTLSNLPKSDKKLVVRVNPLDEGGAEEIGVLNGFRPDAIRVPKVRSVTDVKNALALVDDEIELHLSIETKEAWTAMAELAIDERVTTFYLGILDLFADLGLPQKLITPENPTLRYMLSHFLVTAKAAGIKPVSFVFQDYRDEEGFERWLSLEKEMGYTAKGCLSPKQALAVQKVFGYAVEEIEKAHEIIRLFETKRAEGVTGFTHERYGFIDEPIYKGAKALLDAAGE